MPEMLASRLVALQKRNGGVRPVAVGEVWMRFCCLCAREIYAEASISLAPLQLGVDVAFWRQGVCWALTSLCSQKRAPLLRNAVVRGSSHQACT